MVAGEIDDALAHIDRLVASGAPYDEVVKALDASVELPGADRMMPGIGQRRVGVTLMYDRSDEERERAILGFLAIEQPLAYRASTMISACADRPQLAEQYLLPLIDELESADLADEELASTLRSARAACARLGVAGG